MKSFIRSMSKSSVVAVLCLTMTVVPLAGCSQQQTVADIVGDVGTAVAAVLTIEGNSTAASVTLKLAQTVESDALAWQTGTSTAVVISDINLLVGNLQSLPIPINANDAELIQIAVSFAEQLLTQFGVSAPSALASPRVAIASAPTTLPPNSKLKALHSSFKAQWNAKVAQDPSRAAAKIK